MLDCLMMLWDDDTRYQGGGGDPLEIEVITIGWDLRVCPLAVRDSGRVEGS